jgi:cytoskeletal protein RodZ
MSSVGPYLRELREQRGVSLEEIARTTRVGRSYLEALEAGEFGKLPAPVFTRGFVLAYCQALGVAADEALARYGGRAEPESDAPAAASTPTTAQARAAARARGPVLVSFVLLIVLGVALAAVALVLQSGREVDDRRTDTARSARRETPRDAVRPEAAPTDKITATTTTSAPSTTPSPMSSPAPSATAPTATAPVTRPSATAGDRSATVPPTVTPAPVPPAAPLTQQEVTGAIGAVNAPYRLIARTNATTWIRVRTDDGRQTEETLGPGQVREWVSNRPFTLSVGNAGGVKLELNGRTLPPLGPPGAVIGRLVLPSDSP